MATNDSPLSVAPSRSLSLALGQGGGEASGSGISVSYTGTGVGETLTITTSSLDFTSKPNAKPLWYIDPGAEGVLTASPLSRTSTSLVGTQIGNLDTETKHGQAAALASFTGSAPDYRLPSGTLGPNLGAVKTNVSGAGDHIRLMTRWRRNFDGLDAYAKWQSLSPGETSWNIKRWRWWAESGSPKNDIVFSYGQQNDAAGDQRITPEQSATGTAKQDGADETLWGMKKDTWVSEIVEIKQSSAAGVGDGFARHIADGQEYLFSNIVTRDDDGNDGVYVDFVIEQWQYLYSDTAFKLWHDFFYLDDTPHAVIITDKPNWSDEGATIDPAIPTAWGQTSITAKTRSSIAGKYLYVIDGNGSVLNTTGVALQ